MRASSWGDVGDYGRLARAQEVASMHSGAGDHDEPLDPDVVVVGAGGVATGPLPPTPSGSAGALSAVAALYPSYGGKMTADRACRGPHVPPLALGSISRGSHGSSGFGAGSASASASSSPVVVGGSSRWHAPRSIMQLSSSLSSEEGGSGAGEGEGACEGEGEADDNASDGDSDSFFARNSEEVARPCVVMNATAHGAFHSDHSYGGVDDDDWEYGGSAPHSAGADRGKDVYGVGEDDEDDEEEDDEDEDGGSVGGQPIEVRRRQLSWAVHDDNEDEDDEDDDEPPPLSESDDPGGAGG